jgi:hypothetical protein
MHEDQRTQCSKAKLSGFRKLNSAGDQHGVNILQVNLTAIVDKLAWMPFQRLRSFPFQYDVISANLVPAWL